MYRISKEFVFAAGHRLDNLPDDHKCSRQHGHNYRVVVVLESEELDKNGFVMDYGDLWLFKQYLENRIDHRNLNDLFDFPTTAENIAREFYGVCKAFFPETVSVQVSETPKTWASYSEV